MKPFVLFIGLLLFIPHAFADLKYQPIQFSLSIEKDSYFEGEKIQLNITITNTDKNTSFPVLLPHTQNTGQKLFYLNIFDKANNTHLLRYTENRMLQMMVHDTGSVQIRYLKPLEQIVVPIYLNDFENYYSYHTQNASHHSFGVPLFASIYKVNVVYNPFGIDLSNTIYSFYDGSKTSPEDSDFLTSIPHGLDMPTTGYSSNLAELKIKRSADTIISIERQKYYIKTNGDMYYYYNTPVDKITTDMRCIHITTLPSDSCSLMKSEYFYSQFPDLYNEYIARFDDGDIREYRKFTNYCPEYLLTERYNVSKQKTHYELQLPDKRFYSVAYNQPSGSIHQETYCSENGTLCNVTTYVYKKTGELKNKVVSQTQPCVEVMIDGKKRSSRYVVNLEGQ